MSIGRPEILEAARRIGDFLVSVAPRFNTRSVQRFFSEGRFATGYVCWTQNLEGLVELYRQTSDDRFLELAQQLAKRASRHPSQHSHGFLSTLRGILELARTTGDQRFLDQVEREWKGIVDSENLLVQGAIPEAFAPSIERDEGCSEADWLRLNLEGCGMRPAARGISNRRNARSSTNFSSTSSLAAISDISVCGKQG